LIRREGTDRFSMRRLAKQLGVTPMAVYYYVKSKAEMFERVADAVLGRVPRPAPSGVDWRGELKAASLSGFRVLSEYPGLSAQIVKQPPTQIAEQSAAYGISILVAAGFNPGVAARITTTCQAFMFGMIGLQAQIERAKRVKQPSRASTTYLAQMDAYEFVEAGLDALLAGFAAQHAQAGRGAKRRARAS
jgi:TetR/AcrR family tetracycline transcriptional repressor